MPQYRNSFWLVLLGFIACPTGDSSAQYDEVLDQYRKSVQPLLKKYCYECHRGKNANADIDFSKLTTQTHVMEAYEVWESAVEQIAAHAMPPEEHPQPTVNERKSIQFWYRQFVANVEPKPASFAARRLSVLEYRNSLRSLLGFDLQVAIIEAEQTVAERSMVIKLLPTDPPGESGFTNDTHRNPLSVTAWDQYSLLVDLGLEELFSKSRRAKLQKFTGPMDSWFPSESQAERLVRSFVPRAWRRPVEESEISQIVDRLNGLEDQALVDALKLELKSVLMSPSFLYRGLRMKLEPGRRHAVDQFELAERLSYFLWADMPDQTLMNAATDGRLADPDRLKKQIGRMLSSPKARALSEVFGLEWFTLDEIEKLSNNPPQMVALKSQPLDFLNYLFTENRPLLELVDSETAFVNPFTARMYGSDARQMKRYVKQKGIEVEIVPNQKIRLKASAVRGGIITIPGILAMNKGPILRGTWVLERILGEHLPDPPANVGQVPRNRKGENLSFRERFQLHRSNKTCAICHDRIDPLGFGLEGFNSGGAYVLRNARPFKQKTGNGKALKDSETLDVSGKFPSGEEFNGVIELKKILTTSKRQQVIRNIVKRTMSYALCRKLKVHDQPTIESIVRAMDETNGTWRDLFVAIANSPQFRETIAPPEAERLVPPAEKNSP